MTEATLEQRVRLLEDIEGIKTLTARYANAVDQGWNGKAVDLAEIPSIFATDARWTGDDFGTTEGVDAIVAGLPAATGSWLLWIASIYDDYPGAVYMSADMTYIRTAVGWRIQTVCVHNGIRIPATRERA